MTIRVRTRVCLAIVLAGAVVAWACERAQLLAPTNSTITVSAPTRILPTNGSTEVTAYVLEQAGTPVQNGTTVRFSTSLGRVDPVEVQTRNGLAITTFFAGNNSGVAEIRATSGGATGTTSGTGDGATASDLVRITVGSAAVKAISVRANPASVGSAGGTVDLIASVISTDGGALPGVLVTFNANQGTLGSSTALTNSDGEARTTLTTSQNTTVSATAGLITSSDITVAAVAPPGVTLATAPASPAAGQPVTLTVTPTVASGGAAPRVVVQWGDGTQDDLGTISSARSVAHVYSNPGNFTITVQLTANGETTTASTGVTVGAAPSVTVSASPTSGAFATTTFVFTITPVASANPQNVRIDFGDGTDLSLGAITTPTTVTRRYSAAGQYTVRVTQENQSGSSSAATVVVTATP
jgi:hypothetical protein